MEKPEDIEERPLVELLSFAWSLFKVFAVLYTLAAGIDWLDSQDGCDPACETRKSDKVFESMSDEEKQEWYEDYQNDSFGDSYR